MGEFATYSESNAGLSDYEYEMGDEDVAPDSDAEEPEGRDIQVYTHEVDRVGIEAYVDEPIATPEWLQHYRGQKSKHDEEINVLQQRLDKTIATTIWYVFILKVVPRVSNTQ